MATKLIITIREKLKNKYGNNIIVLEKLFGRLIVSDAGRGLQTKIIYLDDPLMVQRYGYVIDSLWGEKVCKDTFDQIYWHEKPEYMAIFGAQDVFPFQSLINPLYGPGHDNDKEIPSDLPYASDSPYSTDCNSFINPTRVVGRIPDLPYEHHDGQGDIDYVKDIIEHIIDAVPANIPSVADYFSISADQWKLSTQESLRKIFGNSFAMKLSPPNIVGSYKSTDLAMLSHYFNLHGALGRRAFYGQRASSYPEAINTTDLVNLTPGTFVAAECCYGAQLLPLPIGMSMASTYLKQKATVFMGSSTISYGPPSGQALADLICQYFNINLLKGASSGRALLDARQKFITDNGPTIDAHELKTISQFYILGDPSLQPVKNSDTADFITTIEERRSNLTAKGFNLGLTIPNTIKKEDYKDLKSFEILGISSLLNEFSDFKSPVSRMVFEVENSSAENFKFINAIMPKDVPSEPETIRFHVFQSGGVDENGICRIEALVIKERNAKFMGYKKYVSK